MTVPVEPAVLTGDHVRLEPLDQRHVPGLVAAANEDRSLYDWSAVPGTEAEMAAYVATARAWHEAGTALAFATVNLANGRILGSSRFFEIARWPWPEGHPRHGHPGVDGCEIGYTWLSASAVRTAANTEAKLLMLTHAFETWEAFRVCFHTDVRNERSAAAIARIGGVREGLLRAHRFAVDLKPRDSLRFSITAEEWPAVRDRLRARLGQA